MVQRAPTETDMDIGYSTTLADPEKNLVALPGKIRDLRHDKSDMLNSMGYSPEGTFKPYPTHIAWP